MAEESLPEDVFFLEHAGMTRKQLMDLPNGRCKICNRKSKDGENALCMLCPYPAFYCHAHQIDVYHVIGENFTLYGLCHAHRGAFNAIVASVKASHGRFPAHEEDFATSRKTRLADLNWQEELRRSILRFRSGQVIAVPNKKQKKESK